MRHGGRSTADDSLVLALAAGQTVKDAAALSGVSQMTVYRRLRLPSFRSKMSSIRCRIVTLAVGRLANVYADAVGALAGLLKSESETVRLHAAKAILEVRLHDAASAEEKAEQHERSEASWRREKAKDRQRRQKLIEEVRAERRAAGLPVPSTNGRTHHG